MTTLRLGIPLYVHPAVDPDAWAALAGLVDCLEFVVVNVHNGPGEAVDVAYRRTIDLAHAAGVPLLGYVHTTWGDRALPDVVADADTWRRRYGVAGLFVDEVATPDDTFGYYRVLADRLRRDGCGPLVFNPGCAAGDRLYALADLTCTFEGPASLHALARQRAHPAAHLVYETAAPQVVAVADHARASGATVVFATDGRLPNPWDHLPVHLPALCAVARRTGVPREQYP